MIMHGLATVNHDGAWWLARAGAILLSAIIWTLVRKFFNRRR